MNTTAAIKKRCASVGKSVEMTTFGTTGHSCGSTQVDARICGAELGETSRVH